MDLFPLGVLLDLFGLKIWGKKDPLKLGGTRRELVEKFSF